MKKIKTFVSGIMACALLFVCAAGVNADTKNDIKNSSATVGNLSTGNYTTSTAVKVIDINEQVENPHPLLKDLGEVAYKKALIIDDEKNLLTFTFVDPEKALANAKEKDKDTLEKISKEYNLDELTSDNWEDYKDVLDQHCCGKLFDGDTEKVLNRQRNQLEVFFDIYENDGENSETLDLVSNANKYLENHKKVSLDNIISDLPFTDPIVDTYEEMVHKKENSEIHTNQVVGLQDLTSANDYAREYAE